RLEKFFARQKSFAGTGAGNFQRIARGCKHAAVLHLVHFRRPDRAAGEHADVCRGAAEKSCAVRFAHLPKRRPRHGFGHGHPDAAVRESASVDGGLFVLAEGAGLGEVIPSKNCSSGRESAQILRMSRLTPAATTFFSTKGAGAK